ncbi:MAG: hypothetical protein LUD02_02645 [Tannerellaceae bacterium]|nr:hypothetical protein [Tannerellaceae bacterium]
MSRPSLEQLRILNSQEKKQLKMLEDKREKLLDLIAADPSNSSLVAQLNAHDVKIVALTGEFMIDY